MTWLGRLNRKHDLVGPDDIVPLVFLSPIIVVTLVVGAYLCLSALEHYRADHAVVVVRNLGDAVVLPAAVECEGPVDCLPLKAAAIESKASRAMTLETQPIRHWRSASASLTILGHRVEMSRWAATPWQVTVRPPEPAWTQVAAAVSRSGRELVIDITVFKERRSTMTPPDPDKERSDRLDENLSRKAKDTGKELLRRWR